MDSKQKDVSKVNDLVLVYL